MDKNDLYKLIQKIIIEAYERYGIKLYGRLDEENYELKIEFVGYLRKNGWFEVTTPVTLSRQDITPFLFESIMRQARKVAEIRDGKDNE